MNKKFWTEEKPVYPLLQKLAGGKEYASLLHISDDVEEIIAHIMAFTEMKKG
jgi:hypothetical protein